MSTNDSQGYNPTDGANGRSDSDWTDLSRFQIDVLVTIEDYGGPVIHGLGIKTALQDFYGEEINHGRLYPNLDDLIERGLVSKSCIDDRANGYALTDRGVWLLESRAQWLTAQIDLEYPEVPGDE